MKKFIRFVWYSTYTILEFISIFFLATGITGASVFVAVLLWVVMSIVTTAINFGCKPVTP